LRKQIEREDSELVKVFRKNATGFRKGSGADSKNNSNTIIGAVAGDLIGSVFEWKNIKTTVFNMFNPQCDFTDDTVLTIAVADSILNNKDFANTIWEYGRRYRGRGYGGNFRKWLQQENLKPYESYGNGSAMRVSAVGFAFENIETVLDIAKQTAEVTHNHPEGIKGAQATATAIFLARQGKSKQEIRDYISSAFKYNLDFTLDEIRPTYKFDVTCQGSVPHAIAAFLESTNYESAIRLAISIGGDSDTIACITGGIASAYYKEIPKGMIDFVVEKLPAEFIDIMNKFDEKYNKK
jgi:ADP-ribosylglycohydrolase